MNEDIFLLHDFRFPRDTAGLVQLLNKYNFQNYSTWTYDPGSFIVFPADWGSGQYYGDFFARVLAQYLECLEYLNRIISNRAEPFETTPDLSVLANYHFYLSPGDCLPADTYTRREIIPAHLVRRLQSQIQH